jgi:hypothetical protein
VATAESPVDFKAVAFDLDAAADNMRAYLERLSALIKVFYTTDGRIAESYPPEFEVQSDDLFRALRAGERAFIRNLGAYSQLVDEWIPITFNQFKSFTVRGLRSVFVERIDILDRCASVARQRAGLAPRTEFPAIHYHNYFGEVHMGDVFQGISNSTIVSRSMVEGAFNRLQDNGQPESAKLLVDVGKHVADANNAAAGAVYSQMTEELSKPAHDKRVLRSYWDGLVAILPPLANLSAAVIKAFAI